jgi:hypothetical protein
MNSFRERGSYMRKMLEAVLAPELLLERAEI